MATSTQLTKPDTKQLEKVTTSLRTRIADLLKVGVKKENFAAFGIILKEVRDGKKLVGFVCDPFIAIAKKGWDDAKGEKAKHLAPLEGLESQLEKPIEDYLRIEREAKEAEQREINERNRRETAAKAEQERKEREAQAEKDRIAREAQAAADRKEREKELKRQQEAGEINKREAEKKRQEAKEKAEREKIAAQEEERIRNEQAAKEAEEKKANVEEVVLESTTPAVAGIRKRVNYYGEILPVAEGHKHPIILEAMTTTDANRRAFLLQFVTTDEKEVGKFARNTKNPKVAENLIPGCRFWSEDSV